ncbi:MAG: type II toxin-antitoxin system VapC family toxin [Acetobacteraceae bacterium]
MIRVVDASVALKWFIEEDGTAQAVALLRSGDTLIAPDLIVPEVCNAAWKALRAGLIHPSQQSAIAARLPSALDSLVPTGSLAPRASALAQMLDHPAYDCFYLALAEQQAATLVTADRRLLGRLKDTMWAGLAEDLRTRPDA